MVRDKSGNRYEKLLEASLLHLGYANNSDSGKNYIRPSIREAVIIPGTFIQPDIVIRMNDHILAVLYVTHWSNRRNSNFKFWRTWEEVSQQKIVLSEEPLTINCVFEALSQNLAPHIYASSDVLPKDKARSDESPIAFDGWYAAISWAMVESFDASLIFPKNYGSAKGEINILKGEHDQVTSELLRVSLQKRPKPFLKSQWTTLRDIRNQNAGLTGSLQDTRSRYRIGLLHVYLCYRLFDNIIKGTQLNLHEFVTALSSTEAGKVHLNKIIKKTAFSKISLPELVKVFTKLSTVFVRKSKNAGTLCTISSLHNPLISTSVYRVKLNSDLAICLEDLAKHIDEEGFTEAIQRAFERFDSTPMINEFLEDLVDDSLVVAKREFVEKIFPSSLSSESDLDDKLQIHAKELSPERTQVSSHQQNWVYEMLLYLTGLNSDEDIQTQLKENFEEISSPHVLRPHAPYGDEAKLSRYLLQGKDICSHWSPRSRKRTLTESEFRTLSWRTVSRSIVQSFRQKDKIVQSSDEITRRYVQNKAMRIIGADLDSFNILLDHYLSDICFLQFTDDAKNYKEELRQRLCASWQTDLINTLWNGRPLETWMDGVSKNGKWLIKSQSAQDGNEGHKTKELAGRCRAMRLAWSHGEDPRDRSQWSFSERTLPKLALVLDGDWDAKKKRNLYEAGWDWIGDVSQLQELRDLIQQ